MVRRWRIGRVIAGSRCGEKSAERRAVVIRRSFLEVLLRESHQLLRHGQRHIDTALFMLGGRVRRAGSRGSGPLSAHLDPSHEVVVEPYAGRLWNEIELVDALRYEIKRGAGHG